MNGEWIAQSLEDKKKEMKRREGGDEGEATIEIDIGRGQSGSAGLRSSLKRQTDTVRFCSLWAQTSNGFPPPHNY